MLDKSFLQSRVKFFFTDHIKEQFGKTIKLYLPKSLGSSTKRAWSIQALVTDLNQEDKNRYSEDVTLFRTVDIYLEDIETLKTANPTAYIPTSNFQKQSEIGIEGARYKIREEMPSQQFETAVRFICERMLA